MITLVYPEDGRLEQLVPLGLCFVGAYLERYGIRVNALDMRHHKIDDLKRAAKTSEFLGFSVMTIRLNKALKFAQIAKKANPKVKIIFGGPHPSIYPKETLTNKQVDFVVIGEGEKRPSIWFGIATNQGRSTALPTKRAADHHHQTPRPD